MLNKLKAFAAWPLKRKWLYAEAFLCLGWARILKLLPFANIAPKLGLRMFETPFEHAADEKMVKSVSQAVRTMSRYTWWESMCLVQAIAASKMLERRGVSSTLYLGTGKDPSGRMIAHAWLRSGKIYLTGYEQMQHFTVVALFGNTVK
ncbi:lasso peptide biosynthesis B2 protein [Paenibacillus sp. MWE-103]|uniref:Lasso peptide biosynthesis B2 protein n=1 Tax=Paenibacillus artemisiicola TaxID=1172618 RepID=A0ABS3WHI6_9BACL|nr:lasso peptide biosynthesis B2 protein [Paenibacillus artemisiicola]MBO7747796.1 lasso peptide biosynthesis B2 protein [Paenibacillus artemisiicola]